MVCIVCIIKKGQGCEERGGYCNPETARLVHVRTRGSHQQFHHPSRAGLVTVPHPRKDIKPGTLAQICRQAGIKM